MEVQRDLVDPPPKSENDRRMVAAIILGDDGLDYWKICPVSISCNGFSRSGVSTFEFKCSSRRLVPEGQKRVAQHFECWVGVKIGSRAGGTQENSPKTYTAF